MKATADDSSLVTILTALDATVLPVVEGLLREAGIPCWARREGLRDLFPWGRKDGGSSYLVGPIMIQVRATDEVAARELLTKAELPADSNLPEELS